MGTTNSELLRLGIDIGSTTAKLVVIDASGALLFSRYARHNAKAPEVVASILREIVSTLGDVEVSARVTGSVGMGMADACRLPFVQEVVAAAKSVGRSHPEAASLIDIGGEDAKVVFFKDGEAVDLRMNGNCAGGTGAFIDQMAVILGTTVDELNTLALEATQIYPIASRCGVFCKTDVQNLVAKNVSRADIAASIFHAVAVQTVVTLAHGCDITPPILFCGGPLTFIPALKKAFEDYLGLRPEDVILPRYGTLLPAIGAALSDTADADPRKISDLLAGLTRRPADAAPRHHGLPPVFGDAAERTAWLERMSRDKVGRTALHPGTMDALVGIDSGSTTTKIVVTDTRHRLLYTFYENNAGSPVETVAKGLEELRSRCEKAGTTLNIIGSCSTGYGEDLIKAAFRLGHGIVETMGHYTAAAHLRKDVSFILDIGGQDMKAIFVNQGVIDRIEINEACSSGCGSFIETFAKTLGYSAADFAQEACRSTAPCDLGTRCTVFMNSKVKQVLREGATVADISAGLAYSVVKNCLYKVLKLKDLAVLGRRIVVQGGTMRNDAIVRVLEGLTGAEVTRCDVPELMGALGCALYAAEHPSTPTTLDEMLAKARYDQRTLHCKGCENRCLVARYAFENGKTYYSGNRCEKVFTNGAAGQRKGENIYAYKNELLFGRTAEIDRPVLTIGLPRCLNMYENFPFWHALFTGCGIRVVLSEVSRFVTYEKSARMVMSDNICFPAKLVHGHIRDLLGKNVDRIFMPFVVYERNDGEQDSFNCPIVTGYAEVVKSVQDEGTPIDAPAISFKDRGLLFKQCREYLRGLGIPDRDIRKAFDAAEAAQTDYATALVQRNKEILDLAKRRGELAILLAGRPYHADFLVQHKVSDLLRDMGIHVLSDDLVRGADVPEAGAHFLAQWSYPNRILKAARWCAAEDSGVQFVEMTSFGCGPDAFLVDEVRDVLHRRGKVLTLLKLDDINNIGSMKLRVRSLVESLKMAGEAKRKAAVAESFKTVPVYDERYRGCKILVPYFTPFLSPLIPAIMGLAGYDVDNLPMSDVASCESGLKYANNEVCYPATLVVGDIVKAFESGKYDPRRTVVAMTQTGGQCRASNYVALIKRALVNAGFSDVPVVAITFGEDLGNEQPAFKLNWRKVLPAALHGILYSDCIAKLYYATVVREREAGAADRLKELYLERARVLISRNRSGALTELFAEAVADFNAACREASAPKVGVVGEIFLKFNPFAQKNVVNWLTMQGVEVMPPMLADFFLQAFVNRKANEAAHLQKKTWTGPLYTLFYRLVSRELRKINRIGAGFRYFTPFADIFAEAKEAEKVVSLNAQFGEGWLLPAEIMSYAGMGVRNVISLQPFGCIANHIVSKGVEHRIKKHYPGLNLLSLDFDSGVSDVNVTNRMLLFIDTLKKNHETTRV